MTKKLSIPVMETTPFGVKVNIHLVDKAVAAGGEKLGTYGVIKGSSTFLGIRREHASFI